MQNPLCEIIEKLNAAGKSNNASVWVACAKMLQRSRSRRVEVNLERINRYTRDGSKIIVPGKVLAKGNINHKIIIGTFSISQTAAKKIKDAGGSILTIEEMLNRYPDGKEVIIIG
ncbi:MAG: 50S ribosomal protein L18e [Candidatus Nitrosocaldaceae archaeon]